MSVKVFFADGSEEVFQSADSATPNGPLFVVSRYNSKTRYMDEVRAFPNNQVSMAEVTKNGRVTGLIVGGGRRESN